MNNQGVYKNSRVRSGVAQIAQPSRTHVVFVLIFLIFEYLRIQESFFPFLAPFKFPAISTLVLLYFLLKSDKAVLRDATPKLMTLFLLEIIILVPFSTNNYHAFQVAKTMTLTLVTVFSMIIAINNIKNFRTLIRIWVIIHTINAAWVLTHGGTGPGGFLKDENDICAMLVMALPFSFYMALEKGKSFRTRLFYAISAVVILSGIVMTSSRGGFLGLVAVLLLMIWLSDKRWRNLTIAFFLAFSMAGALISFLPDNYVKDMQTISDKNDGTRNLRLLHWTTAVEIYKDYPIFGVGPNNYPWRSNEYFHLSPYFKEGARVRSGRVAHSLYFSLIPELGTVGIILFIFIVVKPTKKLLDLLRSTGKFDELQFMRYMAKAMLCSLAGFLVSAAFISVLYYPMLWHLIGFMVVLYKIYSRSNERAVQC